MGESQRGRDTMGSLIRSSPGNVVIGKTQPLCYRWTGASSELSINVGFCTQRRKFVCMSALLGRRYFLPLIFLISRSSLIFLLRLGRSHVLSLGPIFHPLFSASTAEYFIPTAQAWGRQQAKDRLSKAEEQERALSLGSAMSVTEANGA
ncbi:hypothetical protein MHYP_G00181880 [Metynnis hypsauchen]